MIQRFQQDTSTPSSGVTDWHELAAQVLGGRALRAEDGLTILRCPDDELLDLLSAAFRIRRQFFGKTVQLYFLINAKSGLCKEDCSFCAQSVKYPTGVTEYPMSEPGKIVGAAIDAAIRGKGVLDRHQRHGH